MLPEHGEHIHDCVFFCEVERHEIVTKKLQKSYKSYIKKLQKL